MKPEYYDLICLIEDAEQSGDSQIIENGKNARKQLAEIVDRLILLEKFILELSEKCGDL